jgi:hypothetical protein
MRIGLALVVLLSASTAQGYVREKTNSGIGVRWGSSCVTLTPDSSPPFGFSTDASTAALTRAIAHWQSSTTACAYLALSATAPEKTEARLDRVNVVKFRKDQWCRPPEDSTGQMCFSADAASITTSFYVAGTGEILDSDIELNDVGFTFFDEPATTSPRPGTKEADLEATLTHELGHFQGLDHTCWDHSSPVQPTDDEGRLVPDCASLAILPSSESSAITNSVMYPFAPLSSTVHRTPQTADIQAICALYPTDANPGVCRPPQTAKGCCSTAGSPVLMLAMLGLCALRRRPRIA